MSLSVLRLRKTSLRLRSRSRLVAFAIAVLGCLTSVTPSDAATVEMLAPVSHPEGWTIAVAYRAAQGEANDVVITHTHVEPNEVVTITDASASITAIAPCTALDEHHAECRSGPIRVHGA